MVYVATKPDLKDTEHRQLRWTHRRVMVAIAGLFPAVLRTLLP